MVTENQYYIILWNEKINSYQKSDFNSILELLVITFLINIAILIKLNGIPHNLDKIHTGFFYHLKQFCAWKKLVKMSATLFLSLLSVLFPGKIIGNFYFYIFKKYKS